MRHLKTYEGFQWKNDADDFSDIFNIARDGGITVSSEELRNDEFMVKLSNSNIHDEGRPIPNFAELAYDVANRLSNMEHKVRFKITRNRTGFLRGFKAASLKTTNPKDILKIGDIIEIRILMTHYFQPELDKFFKDILKE